jgi:hypothetical protein
MIVTELKIQACGPGFVRAEWNFYVKSKAGPPVILWFILVK